MNREITASGSTVEAAVAEGARQLGVPVANVEYEVLTQPKKGFLGFGEVEAEVRVWCAGGGDLTALNFVKKLADDMNLGAEVSLSHDNVSNGDKLINIEGGESGVLIGHHGETLDALQYLVNLVANRRPDGEEKNYIKVTVDVEGYRAKRENTLRKLAKSMAARVQRTRRAIELEPMRPGERRIIHAEIQNIKGVTTVSEGEDEERRVVIYPDRRKKESASQSEE